MARHNSGPVKNVQHVFRPGSLGSYRQNFLVFLLFVLSITAYLWHTSSVTWNRSKLTDWINSAGHLKDQKTHWTKYTEEIIGWKKIACHIPHLNPFDKSIMKFVDKPKPPNCEKSHPLIFTTDLESNLIQLANISSMGYHNCCYQNLERDGSDRRTKLEENCTRITESKTKIPSHMEFIMVSCLQNGTSKIVDFFQFVHLKSQVEERVGSVGINSTTSSPLNASSYELNKAEVEFFKARTVNVVILGLDAVSHMNFIRTMPLSYDYLTKSLSAHGLFGYTKVGGNTFVNIGPALAGKFVQELKETCWKKTRDHFDNCTFIWKNYEAAGYRTAYGEDAIYMSIFNYQKPGFNRQPTDYYNHAFMYEFAKKIGHDSVCYGPRLSFQISLDFLKKMAFTMEKTRRYFQFIWTTSMTHDFLGRPTLGDKPLLETFQWFKEEGYLEDTVFILMSDHGINYGDVRNTFQGQLEGRMPFLYFIFPNWFKERYRPAVSNLIRNKNKLTTPFDLYETLKDLTDLRSIENIRDRYKTTRTQMPRGISLFLPIPYERTCADAEIPEHFCVCRAKKAVQVDKNPLVEEGARNVVTFINAMFTKFPQCMALSLKKVLNAQVFQIENANFKDGSDAIVNSTDPRLKSQSVTFTISFEVLPSHGTFEATVTRETIGEWKVSGEISRTNLYKNQSICVNDYNLKKFCFCG